MKEKSKETRRIHNHKTRDKAEEALKRNVYRTFIGDAAQIKGSMNDQVWVLGQNANVRDWRLTNGFKILETITIGACTCTHDAYAKALRIQNA